MALTSASTLAEIYAEYKNNANYDAEASPAKAQAFIVACRYLILDLPSSIQKTAGSSSQAVQRDLERIQGELEDAKRWLATNGGGTVGATGGARHLSFEDLRA